MEDFASNVIKQCALSNCGMCTFMEQIGPTLLGVKPASIINIRQQKCLELCHELFSKDSPVAYIAIEDQQKNRLLFLYHKERLAEVLSDRRVTKYLARLGYPAQGTTEEYVAELAQRLRKNGFPHEIGVFMGYPLKDVYGFMGARIPYRKTMGWRMYGDTRASEAVYHQFKNARSHVKSMLLACQ